MEGAPRTPLPITITVSPELVDRIICEVAHRTGARLSPHTRHAILADVIRTGDTRAVGRRPTLWVPRLETWTRDTVRRVLHELAAYLPPHDDAHVTIRAKTDAPEGATTA